ILRGALQGLEDAAIIQHEHPGISHEQLEARYSFANQSIHLFELSVRELRDDAVERVIAHSLAGSFSHPAIERSPERLALVLDCEIDQSCRATECGSARASLEIIGTGSSAERHV